MANKNLRPFHRESLSFSLAEIFSFSIAEFSAEQLSNLRRREELAYETYVFEKNTKDKLLDDRNNREIQAYPGRTIRTVYRIQKFGA